MTVTFVGVAAFAELQTDMTEIAGEISGASGIPFRNYRSFCMSVLFPGVPPHVHPVTQAFEVMIWICIGLYIGAMSRLFYVSADGYSNDST